MTDPTVVASPNLWSWVSPFMAIGGWALGVVTILLSRRKNNAEALKLQEETHQLGLKTLIEVIAEIRVEITRAKAQHKERCEEYEKEARKLKEQIRMLEKQLGL